MHVKKCSQKQLHFASPATWASLQRIKIEKCNFPLCTKILGRITFRQVCPFIFHPTFCQFSANFRSTKHRYKFARLQDVKARKLTLSCCCWRSIRQSLPKWQALPEQPPVKSVVPCLPSFWTTDENQVKELLLLHAAFKIISAEDLFAFKGIRWFTNHAFCLWNSFHEIIFMLLSSPANLVLNFTEQNCRLTLPPHPQLIRITGIHWFPNPPHFLRCMYKNLEASSKKEWCILCTKKCTYLHDVWDW